MKRRFEIAVHNQMMRYAAVSRFRQESDVVRYDTIAVDDWAQTHFISVVAENEGLARTQVERRYPADRGFVIEAVNQA